MINLEPLGSNILAIFFAMAYLAGKMSAIVNLMAAAQCCEKATANLFNTIETVEF